MPRAMMASDIARENAAGSVSATTRGPHAWRTVSLNVRTKISSWGCALLANATDEAITRSRFGRMLLLLSIKNPTDAGTSSAENISSVCGRPSSITVNASRVSPVI